MKNKRTTHNAKSPVAAIDADIESLADAIRTRVITRDTTPANDVDVPLDQMTDKLHLIKLAQRIRLASWTGLEEHGDSLRETNYRTDCTSEEPVTGIVARFQREIGHERSEVPIPVGARALHLAVAGSLTEFDLAYLVRACFPMIPSRDVVRCAPRGGVDGTVHVFVLADSGWRPIGPPAWLSVAAANDNRGLAGPVRVEASP